MENSGARQTRSALLSTDDQYSLDALDHTGLQVKEARYLKIESRRSW